MRTTVFAADLTRLLEFADDVVHDGIHLEAFAGHLFATTRRSDTHVVAHSDGPWEADLARRDIPVVLAWLRRLAPHVLVRIGAARLADGTGTLLTLRCGAESLRLAYPGPADIEQHAPEDQALASA